MSAMGGKDDQPGDATKRVPSPRNSLPAFDPDRYREHVKDLDLTEEQQNEMLLALWTIMVGLIDLSWGVDSVQRLLPEFNELSSQIPHDELEQKQNPTEPFNDSADPAEKGIEPRRAKPNAQPSFIVAFRTKNKNVTATGCKVKSTVAAPMRLSGVLK